jgi:hypothetical protein
LLRGPVETQFGWHIIKVNDKIEENRRPYDEVKESIFTTSSNCDCPGACPPPFRTRRRLRRPDDPAARVVRWYATLRAAEKR